MSRRPVVRLLSLLWLGALGIKPHHNYTLNSSVRMKGISIMAMQLSGTIKFGGAYKVKGKDGSEKIMISFTVADELGNTFACQMWPDNPQHAQLAQMIDSVRYQSVQLAVVGYTCRMREFKDGRAPQPQANFIVSNVVFPSYSNPNGAVPASASGQ